MRAGAAISLAAVLMAACGQIGEPYVRPAVALPQQWSGGIAAEGEDWPAHDWWRAFGSDELDDLIAAAQVDNHDLKAAAARVTQARALVRMAAAARWPLVTAGATGSRTRLADLPATDSFSVDLGAVWDPDLAGVNRHALASAEATLLVTRHGRDAFRISLLSGIAELYFQILALNESLKATRDSLANIRGQLDIFESQMDVGRISALELEQQRTVLANAEAAVASLLQQRRISQNALAVLTGNGVDRMAPSDRLLSSLTVPTVPLGLPAQLLERRPDIRQTEAALIGAHADVGAARAALWPRLQLSLRGGTTAVAAGRLFEPGTGFALLGASVLATIFDAGRLAGQVDVSRARQQELVENYRQAVLSAVRDVEDAVAGIEQFGAQEKAQQQARAHAGEAYRLAEIRYRAGATDFLAVLDAQRTLINADAVLSNTRFQRLRSVVALYRALGGGWENTGQVSTDGL